MNQLIPVRDRILVQVLETPGVSAGGIHIPSGPSNGLVRGRVLVVGEGPALSEKPLAVQVGDVVHYPANSGVEIEVNHTERMKVVPYEHVFLIERSVGTITEVNDEREAGA